MTQLSLEQSEGGSLIMYKRVPICIKITRQRTIYFSLGYFCVIEICIFSKAVAVNMRRKPSSRVAYACRNERMSVHTRRDYGCNHDVNARIIRERIDASAAGCTNALARVVVTNTYNIVILESAFLFSLQWNVEMRIN